MAFPALLDATMIARARVLLNEPTPQHYTDTQIQNMLDRAANLILSTTRCGETLTLAALASGTGTYTFASLFTAPENAIDIETVFYTGATTATPQTAQPGRSLIKITPAIARGQGIVTADGPFGWYEDMSANARALTIYPTPGANEASKMIAILWYQIENTYEDSGTTYNLPDHLKEYALWYVLAQAYQRRKWYTVANLYYSIFYKFLFFHRTDQNPKPVDSADKQRVPDYTQIQS